MAPDPKPSTTSPDSSATGLLSNAPEPLRYGLSTSVQPFEVSGLIRELMPSGVRVLDVGAGAGGASLAVNANKGNEVVCIEPDRDRSEAAAALGLSVYRGYLDAAACQELGKFDVVVLADVLEHQAQPAAMLELTRTCLNDKAIVIASVPNIAHWSIRLGLMFGKFDYEETGIMDATHLRWFTEKTFCTFLQNQGFVVDRVKFSAGTWMRAYNKGIVKLIPTRLRERMVVVLLRLFPRLFGCQIVVRAQLSTG